MIQSNICQSHHCLCKGLRHFLLTALESTTPHECASLEHDSTWLSQKFPDSAVHIQAIYKDVQFLLRSLHFSESWVRARNHLLYSYVIFKHVRAVMRDVLYAGRGCRRSRKLEMIQAYNCATSTCRLGNRSPEILSIARFGFWLLFGISTTSKPPKRLQKVNNALLAVLR